MTGMPDDSLVRQYQTGATRHIAQPGRGIYHETVVISDNGASARTRVPSGPRTRTLTVQAVAGNAGNVYVGDRAVTNSSGSKVGYALRPGESLQEVPIERPHELYLATDTANDKVVIFGVV